MYCFPTPVLFLSRLTGDPTCRVTGVVMEVCRCASPGEGGLPEVDTLGPSADMLYI